MCTLCDSTNINMIIEFVPNCLLLKHRQSFRITPYFKSRNSVQFCDYGSINDIISLAQIWSLASNRLPQSRNRQNGTMVTLAKEREYILYLLTFVVDVMLAARTVTQNRVRTWQITIRICANKLNWQVVNCNIRRLWLISK